MAYHRRLGYGALRYSSILVGGLHIFCVAAGSQQVDYDAVPSPPWDATSCRCPADGIEAGPENASNDRFVLTTECTEFTELKAHLLCSDLRNLCVLCGDTMTFVRGRLRTLPDGDGERIARTDPGTAQTLIRSIMHLLM